MSAVAICAELPQFIGARTYKGFDSKGFLFSIRKLNYHEPIRWEKSIRAGLSELAYTVTEGERGRVKNQRHSIDD